MITCVESCTYPKCFRQCSNPTKSLILFKVTMHFSWWPVGGVISPLPPLVTLTSKETSNDASKWGRKSANQVIATLLFTIVYVAHKHLTVRAVTPMIPCSFTTSSNYFVVFIDRPIAAEMTYCAFKSCMKTTAVSFKLVTLTILEQNVIFFYANTSHILQSAPLVE